MQIKDGAAGDGRMLGEGDTKEEQKIIERKRRERERRSKSMVQEGAIGLNFPTLPTNFRKRWPQVRDDSPSLKKKKEKIFKEDTLGLSRENGRRMKRVERGSLEMDDIQINHTDDGGLRHHRQHSPVISEGHPQQGMASSIYIYVSQTKKF